MNKVKRYAWCTRLAVMAAVFLFSAAMVVRMLTKDKLAGYWELDQATAYEFNGHGRGILRLPLNSYTFRYYMDDAELNLDFDDDTVADSVCIYTPTWSSTTTPARCSV